MSIQLGTLESLGAFVGRSFAHLEEDLTVDRVTSYFAGLGVTLSPALLSQASFLSALASTRSLAGQLGQLATQLSTQADGNDESSVAETIGELLLKLAAVIGSLDAIVNAVGIAPGQVVEDLAVRGLEAEFPNVMSLAALLGVVDRTIDLKPDTADDFSSKPITPANRALHLDRLTDILSSPASKLQELFGWGSGAFDSNSLPARLNTFLQLLGYPSQLVLSGPDSPRVQSSSLVIRPNATTTPPGLDFTFNFDIPDGLDLTLPLSPGLQVHTTTKGSFTRGFVFTIVPPAKVTYAADATFSASLTSTLEKTPIPPATKLVLVGELGGSRLDVDSLSLGMGLNLAFDTAAGQATAEPFARLSVSGGHVLVDLSKGDGFLQSLTSGGKLEANFELGASYSLSRGLQFDAGASLEIVIPLHVSFAGVEMNGVQIRLPFGEPGRSGLPIDVATSLTAAFGPFSLTVDGVGLKLDITFGSGNLGVANVKPAIKLPTGVGVSIDGGGVSGGGFIAHDEATGRYSGVLDLKVFSVNVKAFGLLDTKFPDGTEGVSFVVVITAEFTPIQLGFGFTLNGVGGLLAINRTLDTEALSAAVRTGSIENLLFPSDPVQDAPTILNDLATVFPAAKGHFILGPMAKLGWGTPTLITAELGIVIEFPGPRIAVLGVAHMILPSQDFALMHLQLAADGMLDVPAKEFSLDASLYDSDVAGFGVSGDMAYRLGFGDHAKFLLSVGGFNTGFSPPAKFPSLRRASVDLGVNGNPSLVASGYFALTSNTAQIGASLELNAHGFGIRLHGWIGFDALFVFSPFSFKASFSAGVDVSFHGVGFGVRLSGSLSGPAPWHLSGKVCVSILWWDACLPVDITFGGGQPVALPQIDPWLGTPPQTAPEVAVLGLDATVADPRNWSGSAPPAGFSVVSLAASDGRTPIDPLSAATLRQKVAPLNQKLQKFGEYQPITHTEFSFVSAKLNDIELQPSEVQVVKDLFVPGHFLDLSNADKLSADSYTPMDAGVSLAPNRVTIGSSRPKTLEYETAYINAQGQRIGNQPTFKLTQPQLIGLLGRSASALGGVRRSGAEKYVSKTGLKKVTLAPKSFVVADACSLQKNTAITSTGVTQVQALLALRAHVDANPDDQGRFTVVPAYAAVA
ncbi:MAG TPA: DUF6603 domain-containing protein [Polyangiaceae bacterium]|nr:DUF6603 domain-containing protein [Polyangiaceae bacterium]